MAVGGVADDLDLYLVAIFRADAGEKRNGAFEMLNGRKAAAPADDDSMVFFLWHGNIFVGVDGRGHDDDIFIMVKSIIGQVPVPGKHEVRHGNDARRFPGILQPMKIFIPFGNVQVPDGIVVIKDHLRAGTPEGLFKKYRASHKRLTLDKYNVVPGSMPDIVPV